MASPAIDLTMDDDDDSQRHPKRQKLADSYSQLPPRPLPIPPGYHARSNQWQHQQHQQLPQIQSHPTQTANRNFPPFPPSQPQPQQSAVVSPFIGPSRSSAFFQPSRPTPPTSTPCPAISNGIPPMPALPSRPKVPSNDIPPLPQIIDLTSSPSPPPTGASLSGLSPQLPPKTPVCIGQLTITALVLYPISYLSTTPFTSPSGHVTVPDEYASVRLRYDPGEKARLRTNQETIHIITPPTRGPKGELTGSENFGVMEQKAATLLAPLLSKGLIRMDAKVRRSPSNLQVLPLQLLVFTPKGNIPHVSEFLMKNGLLLEHPVPPFDPARHPGTYYHNPHNPPPGGFARAMHSNRSNFQTRWSQPQMNIASKSVEVNRSQVDEVFNSLRSGDDLEETEPGPNIATSLYPHQKKALSFLLEREAECKGPDGKSSSLWVPRQGRDGTISSWYNIITQREVTQPPRECKGALLADDMGVGKTECSIQCISLVSATLNSARKFASLPLNTVQTSSSTPDEPPLDASHFAGSVWDMPEMSHPSAPSYKGKGKLKAHSQTDSIEAARAARIRTKSRGTLIVCPLSTVANWEEQIREHWAGEVTVVGGAGNPPLSNASFNMDPNGRMRSGAPIKVYVYHGTSRRPEPSYIADFDVVITTYSTLASEFSKQQKSAQAADDDDDGSDNGPNEYDEFGVPVPKKKLKAGMKRKKSAAVYNPAEITSPLQMIHWFRVVLDEAHSIKETSTVASRATCDLMADRRLCLTGTPVQNKLDDLFALIKFLRLDPFDDKSVWTEFIGGPVKFGQSLGIARLQTIMKAVTLRRTKESKDKNGKNILDLPPRRDEMFLLKFSEHEQEVYNSFFDESQAEFAQMSRDGEVMKNYVGILQKILRLRQICDDVELVKGKGLMDQAPNYDELTASISRDGINTSRATAVFALLREMGTAQCVECGVDLATPADANEGGMDEYDTPLNFKRGRKPKGVNGSGASSRGPTRQNSPASPNLRPILTRCQHLFCLECFQNCVCQHWPKVPSDLQHQCSACQSDLTPADAVEVSLDAVDAMSMVGKKAPPAKKEKRQKGSMSENFKPSTKVKALIQDLMPFSRANPSSVNFDPESIEVQMVDDKGNAVDDGITKSVVFSQWTSMLDKIEEALESAGIHYERLDGTMKRDERTRAMEALKHDPRCEVLLVSLRAGGVGLNLTAARRVYLVDPYWNPAVENQAVDRIHRLGQTRPVMAIKLIIENSIEEKLLEVQKRKTELAKMTLGQTLSKAQLQQRRMEELNELLG